MLIKTIAENMHIPDSAHFKRRKQMGRSTDIDARVDGAFEDLGKGCSNFYAKRAKHLKLHKNG
jgi:hypothetical protein